MKFNDEAVLDKEKTNSTKRTNRTSVVKQTEKTACT